MWNDMTKKSFIEITTPFSPLIEKLTMNLEISYLGFVKTLLEKLQINFSQLLTNKHNFKNYCHKKNYRLTRNFGPMYIYFDDYLRYTDAISDF